MTEFLDLFNRNKFDAHLALEIGYTPVLDWYIEIKQGNFGKYEILYNEQESTLEILIAKAYVWLHDYLVEKYGGC